MLNNIASWLGGVLDSVLEGPQYDVEPDTGLVDLQCGRTVFNDVPARMRTELWLSQLHHQRGIRAKTVSRYPSLLAGPPLPIEVREEIDKDCHRTFPGHPWLSRPAGQLALRNVLRAYAAFDPAVGYTQGMAFLAGLFLSYLDEPQSFGALALVMQDRGLRELYLPDDGLALLQVRLWQLGRLAPPRLTAHLEAHAALPVLYASSWFLTCFAADFPLHFAARVMDLVISDCYSAPLMKVAVQILERCESQLLEMNDVEDMVELLKRGVPAWPRGTLHDLLTEALGRGWTPRQESVLREINGAESVADAVARVEKRLTIEPALKIKDQENGRDGQAPAMKADETKEKSSTNSTAENSEDASNRALSPPSTPNNILPLPPPPSGRRDRVDWSGWRPTTPALASVPGELARIQSEIQDEPILDPELSRALSSYAANAHGPIASDGRLSSNPNRAAHVAVKASSPTTPASRRHVSVADDVAPSPFRAHDAGIPSCTKAAEALPEDEFSDFTSSEMPSTVHLDHDAHILSTNQVQDVGGEQDSKQKSSMTELLSELSIGGKNKATMGRAETHSGSLAVEEFGSWRDASAASEEGDGGAVPAMPLSASRRAARLQEMALSDFVATANSPKE